MYTRLCIITRLCAYVVHCVCVCTRLCIRTRLCAYTLVCCMFPKRINMASKVFQLTYKLFKPTSKFITHRTTTDFKPNPHVSNHHPNFGSTLLQICHRWHRTAPRFRPKLSQYCTNKLQVRSGMHDQSYCRTNTAITMSLPCRQTRAVSAVHRSRVCCHAALPLSVLAAAMHSP